MKQEEKRYKNIVFDVGGVLIGYRWEQMLLAYGLEKERAEKVGNIVFTDPIWRKFDAGLIQIEELKAYYEETYPEYAQDIRYFLEHAELMRVDLEDVWSYLPKLKQKGYRLYVLSNYSKVLFDLHTKGAAFLQELDGALISYQVHKIKPDHAIYQALFERYGLDPNECCFFDDREENVIASRECKMDAHVVTDKEDLKNCLEKLWNGSVENLF